MSLRSYQPVARGHPYQIRQAADLILSARRPMIYTGGGVVIGDASEPLTELTRLLGYPITNTLMGLGAYPGTDPQFVGMLGMHGTYEANMAMHECDVLVAVGARFDDRVVGDPRQFCPNARIIHIDIDPSSISKTIQVDVPIVGPVRSILEDLLAALRESNRRPDETALGDWWKRIDAWRATKCLHYERGGDLIKPQYVIEKLYEVTGGEAFVTSDVGQHQMWAAQFHPVREAPPVGEFRRARHDGVRPAGRDGRAVRLPGPRRSRASPAREAS